MRTKSDFYKDWAENLNLQSGKISFYFMYCTLTVNCLKVLCTNFLLFNFCTVTTLSFKYPV